MSTVATATVLPLSSLDGLREAAKPKRSFFGKQQDRYSTWKQENGKELPAYRGQGFVLATLLCFLDDRGIGLMKSEFDPIAKEVEAARGTGCFLLTAELKAAHLEALALSSFTPDELRRYYEDFNATEAAGVEPFMLEGIRFLASVLGFASADNVVLLEIG